MEGRKILSVSVAAYNVEATLAEALEPFLSCEGRERLDVMIVNDGSTDGTARLAAAFAEKAPDVFRIISKENGGWGSTLNVGMAQARGKYFKQLDGDDRFSGENLSGFLDYLEKANADIVYSPFVTFDHRTGERLEVRGECPELPPGQVAALEDMGSFMPEMHGMAVRTELLQESGIAITERCFYTDAEFVLKACGLCRTMEYFDRPVYCYRVALEGQSMSLTGIQKHYKDNEKVLFTLLDHYRTRVDRESVRRIFQKRLGEVCSTQYAFYLALPPSAQIKRELREFDARIRAEGPEFRETDSGAIINLLKRFRCRGYRPLRALKRWRDGGKAKK